jgi:hypothetical protein
MLDQKEMAHVTFLAELKASMVGKLTKLGHAFLKLPRAILSFFAGKKNL